MTVCNAATGRYRITHHSTGPSQTNWAAPTTITINLLIETSPVGPGRLDSLRYSLLIGL